MVLRSRVPACEPFSVWEQQQQANPSGPSTSRINTQHTKHADEVLPPASTSHPSSRQCLLANTSHTPCCSWAALLATLKHACLTWMTTHKT